MSANEYKNFVSALRNQLIRDERINDNKAKQLHKVETEPQRQYALGRRDSARYILEMIKQEFGV
jgi:hypothetical protein